MIFVKSFHSGFTVHLVIGGNPDSVIESILVRNGHKFEPGDECLPTDKGMPSGAVKAVTNSEAVLWFPRKLRFNNIGTISHEVFHLWHLWNQRMNRSVDPDNTSLNNLEVDAYFFSDVADWIYECSTNKTTK